MPEKIIVEEVEGEVELTDTTIDKITETSKKATVHEEDEERITSAGQRAINLIWEHTQRNLAYYVIGVTTSVAGWLSLSGSEAIQSAAFTFLATGAGSVIGFYFGRTNHQKIGGVRQGR